MEQNAAQSPPGVSSAVTMQDQLRALLRVHHGNLLHQIDRLGRMLARIDASDAGCAGAIAEAEGLAHQIKGAGGSIGFAEISRAATELDDRLKTLAALQGAVTADQVQAALAHFAELERIAGQTTPESSTLYHADLSGP
jgi:HPt (histidine-containing phosphotransfer) domain-containing protein